MKLTESKSQLGKLMAEEGIIVEQRSNVNSAYFDGENKLLVVPVFNDDVSTNVLDLMISHEVSHALHTPFEQWKNAIKELKISKSILNVVEDARIESIIKQKYPGLKRVYHFAYKELMDIDFFGLTSIDTDSLNLVDRINLYFKVGFINFISFTEQEQKFVRKVELVKTFDDVIKVSKEIQEYMKSLLEEEYENELELSFEDGFSEIEGSLGFNIEETSDDEYGENSVKGDVGDDDKECDELNEDSEEFNWKRKYSSLEDFISDKLKSHTQESSEEKQKELLKEESKESIYVDVPNYKTSDHVIDYSVILSKLVAETSINLIDFSLFNKFKSENNSIISYIIKEFNLKKNAIGRKKVKISKTGEINTNKLFAYKVSDDIFKRSTSVPKEQNHGLVFFLDWSGSMTHYLNDTIKQLLILLLFCKKCNIPFEVYAFTTNWPKSFDRYKNEHAILSLNGITLMNLFSSRMNNVDFNKMSNYLLNYNGHIIGTKNIYEVPYWNRAPVPDWFCLGNTPLNHTLILSTKLVKEFKEKTKVQIANAVYLTDGESHGLRFSARREYPATYSTMVGSSYMREYSISDNYAYNVYLRDPVYKESLKMKPSRNSFKETNQITTFIKKVCDFKMIAFRLINHRDLTKHFNYISNSSDVLNTKQFNKEGCLEINTNFDKFYFVKANMLQQDSDELTDISDKSSSVIAKQFSKIMESKINNRIFLKKFIEVIS